MDSQPGPIMANRESARWRLSSRRVFCLLFDSGIPEEAAREVISSYCQ